MWMISWVFSAFAENVDKFNCSSEHISTQTSAQLRITRNSVYAQYGRAFQSADLQEHFAKQAWYTVNPNYKDSMLTETDKNCVERVQLFEKNKIAWQKSVDIQGDGIAEHVFFFDTRPMKKKSTDGYDEDICVSAEVCSVVLLIENQVFSIPIGWYKDTQKVEPQVIDISASDKQQEIAITYPAMDYEDAPYQHQIIYGDGGSILTQYFDFSGYSQGAMTVKGDGVLRFSEQTCVDGNTQNLELHYAIQNGRWTQTQKNILSTSPNCAACPFVSLWDGKKWVEQGEILRNIQTAEEETWNGLALHTFSPQIHVRIIERKDEVTYLDFIGIRDGAGGWMLPTVCSSGAHAFCVEDDHYYVMKKGDTLDIEFSIPNLPLGQRVHLEANGYYLPIEQNK